MSLYDRIAEELLSYVSDTALLRLVAPRNFGIHRIDTRALLLSKV